MRTGVDYINSVRDGRKVWVLGEGRIEDISTHPATKPMVDTYAAWYDQHRDPEWRDLLFAPRSRGNGAGSPLAFHVPTSVEDLRLMGRSFAETLFAAGGNLTHTPAYGSLIALGLRDTIRRLNLSKEEVKKAEKYADNIRSAQTFLTLANGNAPLSFRFRPEPEQRRSLRLVRETDAGIVVSGKLGMHTSPAFAEEIYVAGAGGVMIDGRKATFSFAVNAPGVTVICRKIAARHQKPFIAPLSSRFDELDGQVWLEDVLVPWERVFFTSDTSSPAGFAWLAWHQLYCWAAKAEYSLGLAFACADAMNIKENQGMTDLVVDMMVEVQKIRTSFAAAEHDARATDFGEYYPNVLHLASGSLIALESRQRLTEILRILPGSSLVMAPSIDDLSDELTSRGLEDSFGGAGYTALQRAGLLNLVWDHVSSGLDGRESAFELHANGGRNAWRNRLRLNFKDYNELANKALRQLSIAMPETDLTEMMQRPAAARPASAVTAIAPPTNPSS
jgi:4-hydroxyphenylacetate 3-monooxygenase